MPSMLWCSEDFRLELCAGHSSFSTPTLRNLVFIELALYTTFLSCCTRFELCLLVLVKKDLNATVDNKFIVYRCDVRGYKPTFRLIKDYITETIVSSTTISSRDFCCCFIVIN